MLILMDANEGENVKYRSIFLISVLGKCLEHMVQARLEEQIECTRGLSPKQFGFRNGRSTVIR